MQKHVIVSVGVVSQVSHAFVSRGKQRHLVVVKQSYSLGGPNLLSQQMHALDPITLTNQLSQEETL